MKKGWLIGVVALLLATGAGAAGTAYAYGKNDRLPAQYVVGGLQVGGMTPEAAMELVRERLAAAENALVEALPPEAGGNGGDGGALPSLSFKQLGMKAEADEALRALERYRERDWWERAKMRLRGEKGAVYPFHVTWDEAVLEREVRNAWGNAADNAPVDAKREITETDEVVYTPEVMGTKVDLPAMAEQVKQLAPSSLADVEAGEKRSLPVPVIRIAPTITVDSLKEEGIERKIAEFTTSFTGSAAGRSHNVTAAAMALNDTVLQPGEVFEYGKIVAKAEQAYGYREAPVIVQGKLTPGIGGGICQVSSTLYNAILLAGLEVVERRNHSIAVSYLPPGLDATYADGYINFRFRNSTGKQLLIRTVVHDKHVTVKLFGTLDERVTYRTETKQIKVVEPEIKYVGNDTVALGQQRVLQKGEPGRVVDTFRIKLVDGKEVERERLPRSTYRAQAELVAVHPDDPRLKPQESAPTPPKAQEGPVEPV